MEKEGRYVRGGRHGFWVESVKKKRATLVERESPPNNLGSKKEARRKAPASPGVLGPGRAFKNCRLEEEEVHDCLRPGAGRKNCAGGRGNG